MQLSIEEYEARMEQMMDQKIQAIHKCLDAFELRVLERPTPTIDVTTFQMALASLRADVDALLALADECHRSDHTSDTKEARRLRKRERQQLETA
uniref:Integrase core domain containing protein n=1 Tax=Solanum tuberosum TaxID=4113 RepID=M1DQM0_SOLTU